MKTRCACLGVVLLLHLPAVGLAETAEASAKDCLVSLEEQLPKSSNPPAQGAVAQYEFSKPEYGMAANVTALIEKLAMMPRVDRDKAVLAFLAKDSAAFLKATCKTTDAKRLGKLSAASVVKTCRLQERKLAPLTIAPTMQPGAILFSAYLIDVLGRRKATDAEVRLAHWAAHAHRTDENAAGITAP